MCKLSPLFYQDDQISFLSALLSQLGDRRRPHPQGVAKEAQFELRFQKEHAVTFVQPHCDLR
jgi:hypothetical protein